MFKFSKDYKRKWFGLKTEAIEYDKWVHFTGSFFFTALFSLFMPVIYGIILMFIIGLAYEIYQLFTDPWGFSFMDLLANTIGSVLVYVFILLIRNRF